VPTLGAYALVALFRKLRLQGQVKASHAHIANLRMLEFYLTILTNKNPFRHDGTTHRLGKVTLNFSTGENWSNLTTFKF